MNEEEIKKLPGGHTKYRPNTKYSVLHTYYCTDDLKSFTLTECDADNSEKRIPLSTYSWSFHCHAFT